MRKYILIVAMIAATIKVEANTVSLLKPTQIVRDYVSTYLNIASFESARSGIPTSIILAQGILESSCGNSYLATQAKNHFGIKWKSTENRSFITMKDDDKDRKGNIVPSRFVVYGSVEESYRNHSDFLMAGTRYKELFNLERTDYVSWAKGLSNCHYATDPEYANKLIKCIEQYQLNQYDIPMVLSLDDEDATYDNNIANYSKPIIKPIQNNNSTDNQQRNNDSRINDIAENNNSELFEIIGVEAERISSNITWEVKNPENSRKNNQLYEIKPATKPKVIHKKSVKTASKAVATKKKSR
jgi:Mannosyl-glycoprotein endo-beta-N-acetylglucosaminidase